MKRVFFGRILSDLSTQAFHGHFETAKDYSDGTGVFREETRPHHLWFSISTLRFRFHYNVNTGSHIFYEMNGRKQGDPIVEGWDGLTLTQQEAFIGELYGFMRINRMVECTLNEYIDSLCVAPARVG